MLPGKIARQVEWLEAEVMETCRTPLYLRRQYPTFSKELDVARRGIFYNLAKLYYRKNSTAKARRIFRALFCHGDGSRTKGALSEVFVQTPMKKEGDP